MEKEELRVTSSDENNHENFAESNLNDEIIASESKTPLKTPSKETEVKFIVNDSLNGDAKVDIKNVTFAGMAKEELLKYSTDPFWVQTRLFLFILFWGVWLLMFIGAIIIVVQAPRCEGPKPKKWFETGPLMFAREEQIQDLVRETPHLPPLGVKGMIVATLLDQYGDGDVGDHRAVDARWGTLETVKELVVAAKAAGLRLILKMVPNYTGIRHVWFNKSVAGEEPYVDYYVWAPPAGTSSEGKPLPPNNWLSMKGGPAWEWNEDRKQFYLHQFDKSLPDLNFYNPNVLKEMTDILTYWLDIGFSGFTLDKVQYLLEDKLLQNETVGGRPGSFHNEYAFYGHHRTYNLPGVADILADWRTLILNKTEGDGVLMITGEPPIPTDSKENDTTKTVDLVMSSPLLRGLVRNFTAAMLVERLTVYNGSTEWTAIPLAMDLLADLFEEVAVDPILMMGFLLPGTPVTYLGDELGMERAMKPSNVSDIRERQKNRESHYNTYKVLGGIRGTPAITYGSTSVQEWEEMLLLSRHKQGSPGYLLVYNPSQRDIATNLSMVMDLPVELTVFLRSSNYNSTKPAVKDKVDKTQVSVSAKSALMFTFVPPPKET